MSKLAFTEGRIAEIGPTRLTYCQNTALKHVTDIILNTNVRSRKRLYVAKFVANFKVL